MTTLGLDRLAGRCTHGFDLKAHHPAFCGCQDGNEWATFLAALRSAADDQGHVSQNRVRPLVRGRIEPKHVGQLYRRARSEGLIRQVGWEQSDDTEGGNADKQCRVYALTG